jgi:hypothetical protein
MHNIIIKIRERYNKKTFKFEENDEKGKWMKAKNRLLCLKQKCPFGEIFVVPIVLEMAIF